MVIRRIVLGVITDALFFRHGIFLLQAFQRHKMVLWDIPWWITETSVQGHKHDSVVTPRYTEDES
jgi:hypothetical protein